MSPLENFKHCFKCKVLLPLSDYHKGDCKDGKNSQCKRCSCAGSILAAALRRPDPGAIERDRLRAARATELAAAPPETKPCTKCGAAKALELFPKGECRDGKAPRCKVCVSRASNAYTALMRRTNPEFRERLAAEKRAARRKADPMIDVRAADAERRRLEREALAERHDAHVKSLGRHLHYLGRHADAHVKAYRAARGSVRTLPTTACPKRAFERAKAAWRRAKRKGRIAPWCKLRDTVPTYLKALEFEVATGIPWDVDHFVPLKAKLVSGLHCPANLQLLPKIINEAKGNQLGTLL